MGASTIVRSLRATRKGGLVTAIGFLSVSEKHDLIPDIVFGAKTSSWPLSDVRSVPVENDGSTHAGGQDEGEDNWSTL